MRAGTGFRTAPCAVTAPHGARPRPSRSKPSLPPGRSNPGAVDPCFKLRRIEPQVATPLDVVNTPLGHQPAHVPHLTPSTSATPSMSSKSEAVHIATNHVAGVVPTVGSTRCPSSALSARIWVVSMARSRGLDPRGSPHAHHAPGLARFGGHGVSSDGGDVLVGGGAVVAEAGLDALTVP